MLLSLKRNKTLKGLTKSEAKACKAIFFVGLLFLSACKESGVDDLFGIGQGKIGNSALVFNPESHDFGNVAPFPSFSEQQITVTNTSEEVLNLGTVGGVNSNFTISATTCTGVTLAGGASCTVTVKFSPLAGGSHNMALSVSYGDENNTPDSFVSIMGITGSSNADAPSNYELTSVTDTTMTFSWIDNSSNEAGYEVQRCDGSTCDTNFVVAATETLAADSNSHTLTGLTEGEFYKVRIRATSPGANSDFLFGTTTITFGGIQSVDNGNLSTTFTSGIDCDNFDGVYVGLQWNNIANASGYNIFEINSGTPSLVASVGSVSSHRIESLASGTNKVYRVIAVTATGVTSKNTVTDTSLTTSAVSPCFTVAQSGPTRFDDMTRVMFNPLGVWTDGTSKFIAADATNNRVLIWNSIPSSNFQPADVVVGQPDLEQDVANNGGRTASTLNSPAGVFFDGTKLYVADRSNHRVLIWNTLPTANGQPADVVIGQTNFTAATANTAANRLRTPGGVFVQGGKLFIADTDNNRVLIFNSIPTTNFASADVVVGQANFTVRATTCNQSTLRRVRAVWSDGTRLLATAYDQHRVLVWNALPVAAGTNADFVIGQDNFTSCNRNKTNNNTVKVDGLRNPWGVTSDGTNVWIADYINNRIVYHEDYFTTAANGRDLDGVYGPPNATSSSGGTSNIRFNRPSDIVVANNQMWIADQNNHRVIQRSPAPTALGGEVHSLVLGKEDFSKTGSNRVTLNASSVFNPGQMATDGTRFAVTDVTNHRVLLWNTTPSSNKQAADVVLGQADFTSDTRDNGTGDQRLDEPYGVAIKDGKLFVADSRNNRIMIWNTFPTTNHQDADIVLGQPNFTSFGNGNSANQLRFPTAIHFTSDNKMVVADRDNNRVLIWNSVPTANQQPADVVVGQTAFGQSGNAVSQNRMDAPWSVTTIGNALAVSERDNFRVMIWNTIPTVNGANADVVLGQPDFTTRTPDHGGISDNTLDQPFGLASANGKLYVADFDNHRIMIWNSLPTVNKQAANTVFGQSFLTGQTLNSGGRSSSSFAQPTHLFTDGLRLFISEWRNQRTMAIPLP